VILLLLCQHQVHVSFTTVFTATTRPQSHMYEHDSPPGFATFLRRRRSNSIRTVALARAAASMMQTKEDDNSSDHDDDNKTSNDDQNSNQNLSPTTLLRHLNSILSNISTSPTGALVEVDPTLYDLSIERTFLPTPTDRSDRFPSIEERIRLYMGDWYLPPCTDADKVP